MTNPWGPNAPHPGGPPYGAPQNPGYVPQQHIPPQQYGYPQQNGYPPQYGYPQHYPPLPPRKSRTGLLIAGIGVIAVVVIGLVLLFAAPWTSDGDDGPSHETVALDHGVSVDVEVPAGWRVETGDFNDSQAMMLIPEADDRSLSEVDRDGDSMDDGGTAEPIHAVIGIADTCDPSTNVSTGEWKPDSDHDTDDGTEIYRHTAVTRVDSRYCFQIVGIDFGRATTSLESTASELTRKLLADDAITAATAA